MSIAELIMQGTNQTSNSMAGIGDSLAQLGQQVGATLAQKEQQKQAQAMLPYLQQSMQESMQLAQDGDTAGAYSNMMGVFASNPNLMQNQAVLPFLTMGLKGIDDSAARYKQGQEYDQRQAYYNKVTANKTGGSDPQSVDAPRYGFKNISSVDNETVTPLPVDLNQPVDEMSQTTGANQPVQEGTPAQIAGKQNVEGVSALPPEQQKQATMSFGVTDINPDQYEVQNIAGLSKYLPDFVGFAVPKETWKETTATLSGKGELSRNSKLTAPEARENFTKDGGTKTNVEKAIKTMGDKTMTKLFNDYGKDIYALRSSTDQKDDPRGQGAIYTVTGKDGKDIKITGDQYAAIQTIAGITPAVAENAGGTPAIFKPTAQPSTQTNISREDQVKKAQELLGITQPEAATTPAATAPAKPSTPQFSPENPFSEAAAKPVATPPPPAGRGASKESLELYRKNKEKELKDVQAKIDDIKNFRYGKRVATAAEKAKRWEELTQLKKEIESKLQVK
jgi:hypothetical protein